jgi:hypothetical protein
MRRSLHRLSSSVLLRSTSVCTSDGGTNVGIDDVPRVNPSLKNRKKKKKSMIKMFDECEWII